MSTIDPGVEDGIKESAEDVDPQDEDQEVVDDFYQPGHWWFASVACPLLAGTFGPMASGFNICALVEYWRQEVPKGIHAVELGGKKIPDPTWLVVINAISLVSAIVANVALLLNMARRIRFSIAQPVTIVGFQLAGLLLIADMAALTSKPSYGITEPELKPPSRHALTQAFYYAIFAAIIYTVVGLLMCLTVYGAIKGKYKKQFQLNPSQRTLMLQTMSFITYLMLGALVFGYLENWDYENALYWADVTLLTIGLGDYHPTRPVTRGLLFPYAIGGILIVGLVVGSIRSLILERGQEKMSARIVEKRRSHAVHNVDDRRQTIKISFFAKADFSTDPNLSPAQKREEEFNIMRKVQRAAERERRYSALVMSSTFALLLWFVGAYIFMRTEYRNNWSYLDALYFSYTSLLTIGYGDFYPDSNSGKAFFVFWSLLAVPSLTILISNMGDTVVKWFSDITIWIGSLTVLPGEGGLRASFKAAMEQFAKWGRENFSAFTLPGILGAAPIEHKGREERTDYENRMLDRLAERLHTHVGEGDLKYNEEPDKDGDELGKNIQFYHYVLARECRNLQKDLSASPPKEYTWGDWEYFLKLMGNEDDPVDFPGQEQPDILVPDALRAPKDLTQEKTLHHDAADERPDSHGSGGQSGTDTKDFSSSDDDPSKPGQTDGNVDRRTSVAEHDSQRRKKLRRFKHHNPDAEFLANWSWLSAQSPLMSRKSEAEWILERLSAALERELNRMRKGYRRPPPITLKDAQKRQGKEGGGAARGREQESLEKAAKGEE